MSDRDRLSDGDFADVRLSVDQLLETGRELYADLIETVTTRTERTAHGEYTALSQSLAQKYEAWYSLSSRLVSSTLRERVDDFRRLYREESSRSDICGYLIHGHTQYPSRVASRLQNQIALVGAAKATLRSALADLSGTLQARLFDSELDVAAGLRRDGLLRPAGVVAAVVLERHLRSVCASHGLTLKKCSSISKLNDALKNAGVLDLADWRRVQLLGDLRNKCCHQQEDDPTEEDVTDLVDGVAKIIKKVF